MKKLITFILFQIVLVLLLGSPALSETPIEVVKEFVKAGMSADFKKIAGLSCKDFGPYLTVNEAQKIDISDLGFIKEIVRDEKSEFDPKGLRIVVARLKIMGKLAFGSFYVFITDKGWKVYVSGDFIRNFPTEKISISETALRFYSSNRINLDTSLKLAQEIVDATPNSAKAHLKLASLFDLKDLKQKAISEYIKAIKINIRFSEKIITKNNLIAAWTILLGDNNKRLRYYATERLWYTTREPKAISILAEKYNQLILSGNSNIYREATKRLADLSWDIATPILIEELSKNVNFKVSISASLLGEKNERKAVPALCKAIKYNPYKFRIIEGFGIDQSPYGVIAKALGEIGDKKAVPVLKEMLGLSIKGHRIGNGKLYLKPLEQLTDEDWSGYLLFFTGSYQPFTSLLAENRVMGRISSSAKIIEINIQDTKTFNVIAELSAFMKKKRTASIKLTLNRNKWKAVITEEK